jgi:hypothetical protein
MNKSQRNPEDERDVSDDVESDSRRRHRHFKPSTFRNDAKLNCAGSLTTFYRHNLSVGVKS